MINPTPSWPVLVPAGCAPHELSRAPLAAACAQILRDPLPAYRHLKLERQLLQLGVVGQRLTDHQVDHRLMLTALQNLAALTGHQPLVPGHPEGWSDEMIGQAQTSLSDLEFEPLSWQKAEVMSTVAWELLTLLEQLSSSDAASVTLQEPGTSYWFVSPAEVLAQARRAWR